MTRSILPIALLAAASSLTAQTPGSIRGIVRDAERAAIAGVEIVAQPSGVRALTDSAGTFALSGMPPGRQMVVARRLGFLPDSQSVSVSAGQTAVIAVVLQPQPTSLSTVDVEATSVVSARLAGFEKRLAAHNGGRFITRGQIERRGSSRTTDILRGVQGIKMVDSMGTTIAVSSRGPKLTSGGRTEPCVVRVAVDGVIKDPMFSIDLISPIDVHGIEIYPGAATIPPEFNSTGSRHSQCGLIMIWTRSR